MKVFISWSGTRSMALASALNAWLPQVIQAVEPFFSEEMERGIEWMNEIVEKINESTFGLICMTPENQTAPWLLFEAGALFKALPTDNDERRVVPIGFDFATTGEIKPPLGMLNGMIAKESHFKKLVKTINAHATPKLTDAQLDTAFAMWWPKLKEKLDDIGAAPVADGAKQKRGTDEYLDEILSTVRGIARELPVSSPGVSTTHVYRYLSDDDEYAFDRWIKESNVVKPGTVISSSLLRKLRKTYEMGLESNQRDELLRRQAADSAARPADGIDV